MSLLTQPSVCLDWAAEAFECDRKETAQTQCTVVSFNFSETHSFTYHFPCMQKQKGKVPLKSGGLTTSFCMAGEEQCHGSTPPEWHDSALQILDPVLQQLGVRMSVCLWSSDHPLCLFRANWLTSYSAVVGHLPLPVQAEVPPGHCMPHRQSLLLDQSSLLMEGRGCPASRHGHELKGFQSSLVRLLLSV